MDAVALVKHARAIITRLQRVVQSGDLSAGSQGTIIQASEFLRQYAGPKSRFYVSSEAWGNFNHSYAAGLAVSTLDAFIAHVEAGLHEEVTPERRAQIDVVSDFLESANSLLEDPKFHPAAAAVLIGATLEEFLRTWTEAEGLILGSRKPGLDAYTQVLREADLITKQDAKDISAWGGVRNHAAHGEWDQVSDRNRIRLLLEGVNLFMRKYGA